MKTKEELSALKNEVEALSKKLAELSDAELKAVTGGLRDQSENKLGMGFIGMGLKDDAPIAGEYHGEFRPGGPTE